MAIDTAEKRRSASGVGFWLSGLGVTPNASKDQEWRQQSGWGYSGIVAGSPIASTGNTGWLDRFLRHRRSS